MISPTCCPSSSVGAALKSHCPLVLRQRWFSWRTNSCDVSPEHRQARLTAHGKRHGVPGGSGCTQATGRGRMRALSGSRLHARLHPTQCQGGGVRVSKMRDLRARPATLGLLSLRHAAGTLRDGWEQLGKRPNAASAQEFCAASGAPRKTTFDALVWIRIRMAGAATALAAGTLPPRSERRSTLQF